MCRARNLNEIGVAPVITHKDQCAGGLGFARNQLSEAGGTVNVPNRRSLVVERGDVLGAHFSPFALVESFFDEPFLSAVFSMALSDTRS